MVSDINRSLLMYGICLPAWISTFTKERVQEIIKQVTESDSFKVVGCPWVPGMPRFMSLRVLLRPVGETDKRIPIGPTWDDPKYIGRFFKRVVQKKQVIII